MFIPSGFENFFGDIGSSDIRPQKTKKEDQILLHLLEKNTLVICV